MSETEGKPAEPETPEAPDEKPVAEPEPEPADKAEEKEAAPA